MKSVRIGAGAGFAGDRIDPAVELAERGQLDFLVFECLAERTIALAQLERQENPGTGYDPMLVERMTAVLPACRKNGIVIVSNMGAANPKAAAKKTVEVARKLGMFGLRAAYIEGDDVLHLREAFTSFAEQPLPDQTTYFSANAYLGAEPVAEALRHGADVVITGRVADPSLFLGILLHAFQWSSTSYGPLGQGIVVGHLLECAGQLTGGYFADPGYKDVPDMHALGFPMAEVAEDGSAILSKLEGTGGLLDLRTCREQLLYEVFDPAHYVTPDVIADFTTVNLQQVATNQVKVSGGSGKPRPRDFKVSIGIREGVLAEGQISFAGPGALQRAEAAREILEKRLADSGAGDLHFDVIGLNSMHGSRSGAPEPYEVRLRAAARFDDKAAARRLAREVESLYVNGPAGGAGVTYSVRENISIVPALLPRELVKTTVHVEEA
jgi:hypothetical protein